MKYNSFSYADSVLRTPAKFINLIICSFHLIVMLYCYKLALMFVGFNDDLFQPYVLDITFLPSIFPTVSCKEAYKFYFGLLNSL